MPESVEHRLAEFYRRLGVLPPNGSADEAMVQLIAVLDEVEDELSGIPRSMPAPPPGENDGRMYPPQDDFIARNPDGSIIALTRGHRSTGSRFRVAPQSSIFASMAECS
jgi:hypothetical protein